MDYVYVKQLITFKKMCGEGVCMCGGGRRGGGGGRRGLGLIYKLWLFVFQLFERVCKVSLPSTLLH